MGRSYGAGVLLLDLLPFRGARGGFPCDLLWGSTWEGARFAGTTSPSAPNTVRTPLTTRDALGGRAAPNLEGEVLGVARCVGGHGSGTATYLGVVRALEGCEPAEHAREKVRHLSCL